MYLLYGSIRDSKDNDYTTISHDGYFSPVFDPREYSWKTLESQTISASRASEWK